MQIQGFRLGSGRHPDGPALPAGQLVRLAWNREVQLQQRDGHGPAQGHGRAKEQVIPQGLAPGPHQPHQVHQGPQFPPAIIEGMGRQVLQGMGLAQRRQRLGPDQELQPLPPGALESRLVASHVGEGPVEIHHQGPRASGSSFIAQRA